MKLSVQSTSQQKGVQMPTEIQRLERRIEQLEEALVSVSGADRPGHTPTPLTHLFPPVRTIVRRVRRRNAEADDRGAAIDVIGADAERDLRALSHSSHEGTGDA
jgi:cob(I)alamin adenosyltransferase